MKNKIINGIKTWKENPNNRYVRWILADELKDKHRAKIAQGFGAGIPVEQWVAVYDTTITNNGKKGILFTEDKLYLSADNAIVLDEVAAVYEISVLCYWIKKHDGTDVYYDEKSGIREAIPILQLLAGTVQMDEPPKKEYKELHTTYRRELRRRMDACMREICEKSDRFVSMEIADDAFVNKALVRWPQIDPKTIVGFLKVIKNNGTGAIIITEDALYSGTNEKEVIALDGLMEFWQKKRGFRCALYTNHCLKQVFFFVIDSDREVFEELINRFISIYKSLKQEIADGNVIKSGLDLSEGLSRYLKQREDQLIDTYKNAVFVSSTFRDMHYERDIIHEKVQPALNALADQYGESISFCDLRWGVNTENLDSETGAKKVLTVCLDEIEKCNPYMLVMLGERYGWIPKESTVKNALESRPDFYLDELEKSVTALEIEFGTLSRQTNKERVFVYFREMEQLPSADYASEGTKHAEKLNKLKERIQKLVPDRVKTYRLSWDEENQKMDGVDAFAQMVIDDIGTVMETVWSQKEQLMPFEKEMQQHLAYMKKKSGLCYGREELLASCLEKLEDGYHLQALTGESGCGKSTVIGTLGDILENLDANVFPVFSGLTEHTESALGVIQYLCYYMEQLLQIPHKMEQEEEISEEVWLSYMTELVEQYSANAEKPLMILIDAIDQLVADSLRDNLKFIPENVDRLGSKVYMIISCLKEFELAAVPEQMEVASLELDEKPKVIRGILKRNRRELDDVVIEKIVQKKSSDSPLYLTLLIQRLLMMNKNDFDDIMADGDGMSAITKHQLGIIADSSDDISGICKEMIDVAAKRMGGSFVKQAIAYLTISSHGLRENDLEGLLRRDGIAWNRLEFSLFINYLRNIFILREDGCYDFSHKVFRQIFTYDGEKKKELHNNLFRWVEHLPENDFLRDRELLVQCIDASEGKEFMKHVAAWMSADKDVKALNRKLLITCRKDEGVWLTDVVKLIDDDAISGDMVDLFLKYIVSNFGLELDMEGPDLIIREKLYTDLFPIVEHLHKTKGGLEHDRRFGIVISRLGKTFEMKKDYKAAETNYIRSLFYSMNLKTKYEDDQLHADVPTDYRILANLYYKMGDDKQAVYYYEKSIEFAEEAYKKYPDSLYVRRALGWSYKRLGDYYADKELRLLAITNLEKSLEVRRKIVAESFTVYDARQLGYVLDLLGDCYRSEECETAVKYYKELADCRERICQIERTASNMKSLAWAYNDVGRMYYMIDKEQNSTLVLEAYEKCLPIFEESLKKEWDENLCWHMADDYKYCMEMLGGMKDVESRKKMLRYARRAAELYELRAEDQQTEDAYYVWYKMLKMYGGLTDSHTEKVYCYQMQMEIAEKLYEITEDKNYKKMAQAIKGCLLTEKGIGLL